MKLLKQTIFLFIFILTLSFGRDSETLKTITLEFEQKNSFEFAGFFIAKQKGFYKDIGLDVKFKKLADDTNIVNDIASGKSNYAIVKSSSLIDISNGKDIVYLLAIYQSNPLILIADKNSSIKNISDLKHKRIMLTKDFLKDASILSLFVSRNIKIDDLNITKQIFNIQDLSKKRIDVIGGYITNEPYTLKTLGINPIIFNSKDYGFDFYGEILTTSREYLKNNADEVKKFRYATIKGYKYAFDNINETIDMIYKKYNTSNKSKKALLYEAKESKKLAFHKTDKFGNISSQKLEQIYNIYRLLGLTNKNLNIDRIIYKDVFKNIRLSEKEKIHLQNMGKIDLCVDPDWLPFDKIDETGKHIGISADYVKLFEKILSIDIKLVKTSSWSEALDFAKKKKCDILTSIVSTPERKKFLNFTTPYNDFPLVAVTKKDAKEISGLKNLQGKKVGSTNGYAFADLVNSIYPTIDMVNVKNVDEGLKKVADGELFAFVDILPSIVYKIRSQQSANLKISGKIYDYWNLRIGVRKDDKMLLDIIQKAINSISDNQKQDILKKWIKVEYSNGINHRLIWKIIALCFIAFVIILIWIRQINSKNKLLQKAQNEIEKKNIELHTLATTDGLTRLYNRLKLDAILEDEITRSKRYKSRFGICIIDIDHFKNINDTYGHQIGDTILQEISKLLKSYTRDTDYVGRWGGEEFLVICLEVDKDTLYTLMEKIRQKIKSYKFLHVSTITASFGITTYMQNDNIKSILKRADDALYKAKKDGRDRIVMT